MKRKLLLPLAGANWHDVTQLDAVLSSIMVKREVSSERRSKHLCLDAGYRGEPALKIKQFTNKKNVSYQAFAS